MADEESVQHELIQHGDMDDYKVTYWAECRPCQWTGPLRKSSVAAGRTYERHVSGRRG